MPKEERDFVVYVRRNPGYELTVSIRFDVYNGHGLLSLGTSQRRDSEPARTGEQPEVTMDALRAGRFIHVQPTTGKRHSYAFARLTDERLNALSEGVWVLLEPTTEFGFRYLLINPNAEQPGAGHPGAAAGAGKPRAKAAAVAVAPPTTGTHARPLLSGRPTVAETRPTPKRPSGPVTTDTLVNPRHATRRTAGDTSTHSASTAGPATPITSQPFRIPLGDDRPARPVPIEAGLAQAAVQALSKQEAIAKLTQEMAKVSTLHQQLTTLETALTESRQREADLLQVLSKWQSRAAGS